MINRLIREIIGVGLISLLYWNLTVRHTRANLNYQAPIKQISSDIHKPLPKQKKNLEYLSTGILRTTPNLAGIEHSLLKIEQLDYKTSDFYQDSDEVLLARMIFGEGRGMCHPQEEKIEIGYTVVNRINDGALWNGENVKEIILKKYQGRYQYSCFNDWDPNKPILMDPQKYNPEIWRECLGIAKEILSGEYDEFNRGSTHYHMKTMKTYPRWTKSKTMKEISVPESWKHKFYKETL
ncbi:hypothetical protein ES703_64234 [subsurface metagenome]